MWYFYSSFKYGFKFRAYNFGSVVLWKLKYKILVYTFNLDEGQLDEKQLFFTRSLIWKFEQMKKYFSSSFFGLGIGTDEKLNSFIFLPFWWKNFIFHRPLIWKFGTDEKWNSVIFFIWKSIFVPHFLDWKLEHMKN